MTQDAANPFEQIVHTTSPESRLLRVRSLSGGVSAEVTALELGDSNGHTRTLLVRRYGAADLRSNPQVAEREFKLLEFLQTKGVAAPKPIFFDASGELFPTPYLVTDYTEGETVFAPSDPNDFTRRLAAQLAEIHALGSSPELAFLTPLAGLGPRPAVLDESLQEGRIRTALEQTRPETASPLPRHAAPTLLHGDFWPGNVLWRSGRIAAVIDWEDAALGDPLADLANARLELLWALGQDAMHTLTRHYLDVTGLGAANLPYWDLCAALRPAGKLDGWNLGSEREGAMREQHAWFVQQAFAALGR